ncbi:MAG: MATE family efflux transporter [Coprococcus sp.]
MKPEESNQQTYNNKNMQKGSRSSNQIDMLHGGLAGKILMFSLPLAASSILQQLFNSADVAVVGRFAGSDALAAVGSNAAVIALFVNIFVGLSVGVNVSIANYIGQNKTKPIQEIIHTVIAFAIICGLAMAAIGMFIARPLLILIDTPGDVLDMSVLYLRIYFVGMPFIILYNFGAAILRSVGDTKRPMFCLIASGIINVGLNLLLVIVFKMGVAGVAISTVIANIVSTGIVIYILLHEEETLRLHPEKIGIKLPYLMKVLGIGAPSAIQTAVFSISNVLIQSGINSFGANAIAGSSTGLNFEYFTYFVISAYSQAAVTFVSQNYGAGYKNRCKMAVRTSMIEGMIFTATLSIIFMLGGSFFVSIYTKDPEVMKYALIRMKHVMLFEFMTGTYEITAAALRGIGYSMLPAVLTVLGSVGFRIVWMYTVFARYHSYGMLMSVYLASWILTGTMVVTSYILISRRKLKENVV